MSHDDPQAPGAPPPVNESLLDAMESALEPAAALPEPPPPAEPPRRGGLSQPVTLVLGAVALVVLVLVGLVIAAGGIRVDLGGPSGTVPAGATGGPASATPNVGFFPAGGRADAAASPVADRPDQPDPPLPATLAAAGQAEQEGRYEDAIALYRPVAAANPSQPASREAGWHLGVALYDAGQYDSAIAQFHLFASVYPTDTRSLRAAFWAGRAHLAAGRPVTALAEFTSYAPVAGPLRATTLLLAADAAAAQGDHDAERSLLNATLAEPTTRLDRLGAWARLATLETNAGAPDKAAAWYNSIAQTAHTPSYQAQSAYQAGAALLDAQQTGPGEQALINLVKTLPDQPAAYQALQRLRAADANVLSSGRLGYDLACRTAYAAGHYDEAVGYCDSYRSTQTAGPALADAAWYTARAYEAAGNTAQATAAYQSFTSVYTADVRLPDALLHWGDTLAGDGDTPGALAIYARLAAYPKSAAYAAAADQAGLLLRRQGDFGGAATHWAQAAAAPGADDDLRSRALFWRGWALQQQGLGSQAAAVWQQGAAYHTFWGQRSADHLSADTVVPRDTGAAGTADRAAMQALLTPSPQQAASDEQELLRWAASWTTAGNDVPAAGAVPERLAANLEYQRALALAQAQVWDQANLAFEDLASTLEAQRDGTSLAALAMQARHAGWPWLAYNVAHHLRTAATAVGQAPGIAGLPRAAQEMVYPLAWPQAVAAQAQAQDVDPLLLLALVRQESAYDPAAHSGADAYGLTQVVPSTGKGIASALHIAAFTPDLLYRPATSLQFGAFYLHQTLAQFDGNILYGLAGYNAGPGVVPDWAGGRVNNDPDLFVDNIPYAETQAYVEIVYANYAVYRWLYAPPP